MRMGSSRTVLSIETTFFMHAQKKEILWTILVQTKKNEENMKNVIKCIYFNTQEDMQ